MLLVARAILTKVHIPPLIETGGLSVRCIGPDFPRVSRNGTLTRTVVTVDRLIESTSQQFLGSSPIPRTFVKGEELSEFCLAVVCPILRLANRSTCLSRFAPVDTRLDACLSRVCPVAVGVRCRLVRDDLSDFEVGRRA